MILVDNETKIDLLNNEAIALTIIKLIRDHPDRPVTLGVHGDWGAGKSSVLEMIEACLEDDSKVVCLKFNGWRFQGFEDAKIALIEGIVTALIKERSLMTNATQAAKSLLRRVDVLKVAKRGGGLAWNLTTGLPSPDQIGTVIDTLKNFAENPDDVITKENAQEAAKNLGGLLKPAEGKRIPEEVSEFRKDFDNLLKLAGIDQLVVLVDDLDRCLPETAIETLEAIRLFVFTKNTAFVVGADEAMIEYAVRKHFPDLPDTTGPRDYARNYLEKLIQVPFRIPALGDTETRIYVSLLLIGATVGEEDPGFQKLLTKGRELLKRPWKSKPLDTSAVSAALGDQASQAQQMLALSDQIGPLLASGTKGNPRQIKRFLNALLLRKSIADARGFGEDVKLPVLAKLMLAERFLPSVFEQIATIASAAPNGRCRALAVVEQRNEKQEPQKTSSGRSKKSAPAGDKVAAGWLDSDSVTSWADLPPKLAQVDLRPYLFVAKDKKDYFGASTALGKLAEVVERLMGEKLAVRSMAGQITTLAAPEASAVFEELRVNILGKDSYNTKPLGVEGMIALVEAHPHLEGNLLDFLESLPAAKLGVWAVGGWEGSIRAPENKARLKTILDTWSESGSTILKQTAKLAAGKQ